MEQRSKRTAIAVLTVVLAVALGVGVMCALLPWRTWLSRDTVELSEDDFEYGIVSTALYGTDTEETFGEGGSYGWGYQPNKDKPEYAYITKIGISAETLNAIKEKGVTKLVINIPAEHNGVPVRYVAQDAFSDCELTITDIKMPRTVYWQIKKSSRFTLDNSSSFARADGETATFTKFTPEKGANTLVLPSNVWIDENGNGEFEDGEPTYRYTEYLFAGNSGTDYTNLVVMPDVVNAFNGTAQEGDEDKPRMQGGLLSKSTKLKSVNFCTGRTQVLHLFPLTFEDCTSLKEISLAAGVFLEDGARVFQGASALEKFTIANDNATTVPMFYTVGADGALYTNNYTYKYFTQSNTEDLYKWFKVGENGVYDSSLRQYVSKIDRPLVVWNSETMPPPKDDDDWWTYMYEDGVFTSSSTAKWNNISNAKGSGTFKGTPSSPGSSGSSGTVTTYSAKKDASDEYTGGIAIPENSYVFDVNGTDKDGKTDPDNDFATGTQVGQYPEGANFKSATLTTIDGTNSGGTKASISVNGSDSSVKVTEASGGDQSQATVTINGVEYKSRMQFKYGSDRYLQIEVPFDFDLHAYFVGSYTADQAGSSGHPSIALFNSSQFDSTKYSGTTGSKATTAKKNATTAMLTDVNDMTIGDSASHLLEITTSGAKSGTYYIAQPADCEGGTKGYAQMFFLVITPVLTQSAASLKIQIGVPTGTGRNGIVTGYTYESIPLNSITLQKTYDTSGNAVWTDVNNSKIVYDDRNGLMFSVKALTATGAPATTEDVKWSLVHGTGGLESTKHAYGMAQNSGNIYTDNNDFRLKLYENTYYRWSGQDTYDYCYDRYTGPCPGFVGGAHVVVEFTSGSLKTYLYINFRGTVDYDNIPDLDKINSARTTTEQQQAAQTARLTYTEDRMVRYQTLVSMPARCQDADGEIVSAFDFGYHETVAIGANAFQHTQITVIHIPDRISSIGASAFRFSDRLQSVYLPDSATIALNAFGQEPDATDKTVFTAGKKNFFLIAPSRTSYEAYMQPQSSSSNYKTFPMHIEDDDKGFQEWAPEKNGKNPSYDYSPYLTYEIEVNFLSGSGSDITSTARTFLYGMDSRYVKATEQTKWALIDKHYDNNAPIYFGTIKGDSDKTVQQINTLPKDLVWMVAADGWYFDESAAVTGTWYYGETEIKIEDAEGKSDKTAAALTAFLGGKGGDHVSEFTIENRPQTHYSQVISNTTDNVKGIKEVGGKAGDLRKAINENNPGNKETDRWYWEDDKVWETHQTMPFQMTLRDYAVSESSKVIAFDVPTLQSIGTITYADDSVQQGRNLDLHPDESSWRVPMLTVTYDLDGFPVNRILSGFNSSAMSVKYQRWIKDQNNDKVYLWIPGAETDSETDTDSDTETEVTWQVGNEPNPFYAGTYLITLSLVQPTESAYKYVWGGSYNGMRVEARDEGMGDTREMTFILHIQPRTVYINRNYSMQYTGEEFTLLRDNPYVMNYYGSDDNKWGKYHISSYGGASLGPNGLPCGIGTYTTYVAGYDPYFDYEKNEGSPISSVRFMSESGSLASDNSIEIHIGYSTSYLNFRTNLSTFVYDGEPITPEEIFSGGKFYPNVTHSVFYQDGKIVPEIKEAGVYQIALTPKDGYYWTYDDFVLFDQKQWAQFDPDPVGDGNAEKGYAAMASGTFYVTVIVDKKTVAVPKDSYAPSTAEPPYEFYAPSEDYEVVGYSKGRRDVYDEKDPTEWLSLWDTDAPTEAPQIYYVLLRLTDPDNCKWDTSTGREIVSYGTESYAVVKLYAGYDRIVEYPEFDDTKGIVQPADKSATRYLQATITWTYDANLYNYIHLFSSTTSPDYSTVSYVYFGTENPVGGDNGIDWNSKDSIENKFINAKQLRTGYNDISEAGYYGVKFELSDPFVFEGTLDENSGLGEMVAYYFVHVENADITAKFTDDFEQESSTVYHTENKQPIELKLPASVLTSVGDTANPISISYYVDTEESARDNIETNLENLNGGKDITSGNWTADTNAALTPGVYVVYFKAEAANHNVYYGYFVREILSETVTLTLDDWSAIYGDGAHTQETLREELFKKISSVSVNGTSGTVAISDFEGLLNFSFEKDGNVYDFAGTTYLPVGTYTLNVALTNGDDAFVTLAWSGSGSAPTLTVNAHALELNIGTITGHTYLNTPSQTWYGDLSYTSADSFKETVVNNDDLKLTFSFEKDGAPADPLSALAAAGGYAVAVACGNPNYTVVLGGDYTYTVAACQLTLKELGSAVYNAAEQTPAIAFDGLPAWYSLESADYTVTYKTTGGKLGTHDLPLNAGTYTATVTLSSTNFTFEDGNSATTEFVIEQATLTAPALTQTEFPYAGKNLMETVLGALGNYNKALMSVTFYAGKAAAGDALETVTNAGAYNMTFALTDGANYKWSSAPEAVQFEIKQATIDAIWSTGSYTYTGKPFDLPTATAQGLGDDGPLTLTVTLTTPEKGTFQDAGDYTFTAALGSDDASNYILNDATAAKQFTVEQAALTSPYLTQSAFPYTGENLMETVIAALGNYNAVLMNVAFHAGNAAAGDKLDAITDAGTYSLAFTLTDGANYKWLNAPGAVQFTIEQAKVQKPAGSSTRYTYTGKVQTYDVAANPVYKVTGNEQANAGTHEVTVELVNKTNYEWADGSTDNVILHFVIDKATIDVVWSTGSYTYTGKALTMPAATAQGLGDDGQFTLTVTLTKPANGTFQNAGDYTFTAALSGAAANNYTLNSATTAKQFTIERARVQKPAENTTRYTYTGGEQTYAVAANAAYLVSGNKQTSVGTHEVTVELIDKANYVWTDGTTDNVTLRFTIEKATLDSPYLTQSLFSYAGTDLQAAVIEALENYDPDTMTVAFYSGSQRAAEALSEVLNAGMYTVKIVLKDGTNYQWGSGAETALQFTIAKRALSPTLTATDRQATFGDEAGALRPAVSGLLNGFDVSYLYTYEGKDGTVYARSENAPVNAGKYLVTVTAIYAGGINDEPFTVTATAELTIAARELTFSLDPTSGAGGFVNAIFRDKDGNTVALATDSYALSYALNGTETESMSATGEYTVTVTLKGEAATNNTLKNTTAVYKLTQGLTGGDVPSGGETDNPSSGLIGDLDVGAVLLFMGVQLALLAVVIGIAVSRKKKKKNN